MTSYEATSFAHKYHLDLSKDFHTLEAHEVVNVLLAADQWKYRKPKNANGSRGRYFFAYLQRAKHRKES